jgi:hypothetical protein
MMKAEASSSEIAVKHSEVRADVEQYLPGAGAENSEV